MKLRTIVLVLAFVGVGTASVPAGEPRLALRVLYVGESKGPRAGLFAAFLKQHFENVTVADRRGFDPAGAKDAEVVLLDWSQSDSALAQTPAPLGKREAWSKPTVLLNSAGLLIAGHWQVLGGAG
jgi:hypothetical protein